MNNLWLVLFGVVLGISPVAYLHAKGKLGPVLGVAVESRTQNHGKKYLKARKHRTFTKRKTKTSPQKRYSVRKLTKR